MPPWTPGKLQCKKKCGGHVYVHGSDSAEVPNSNVKLGLAPVCKEEGVCKGGVNTSILFYSYGPYWAPAPPWTKLLRNSMSIPRFPPFSASAPFFYNSRTVPAQFPYSTRTVPVVNSHSSRTL